MTSATHTHSQASPPHPTAQANAASPPNRRDLKSWWKGFKIQGKHGQEAHGRHPSLRAPPQTSRAFSLPSLFSEDVNGQMDTSFKTLQAVLRMQDAHVIAPATVAPSVAADNGPKSCRLDKILDFISSPFRRCRACCKPRNVSTKPRALTKQASIENRAHGIFGVPLRQSITYANVAISLIDEDGKSYIYGYVPIVVAKCGVFLKEKGTCNEGHIRLRSLTSK
jgi:GTPase-activating protein SAC7